MAPNLSVPLAVRKGAVPAGIAVDMADAVVRQYAARFGDNHPGTKWAELVARRGRELLGVNA